MGYRPDMARVSKDSYYAARVFHDHIQTGNVSVFDCSAFSYASARPFESVDDVLVDNAIAVVSLLESARFALTCLGAQFVGMNLDICPICAESLKEVQAEIDMLDEWLTDEPEA